jgi:MFS transporter, YNFM family, putative membrane transport protein
MTANRERWALYSLYAATAAVYADMYITQPILPLLSQEFGIVPATAGLTISAVVLAIALASGAYGPLSDSLGRKPVMVWSCALLAIPTLLCAIAPSITSLIVFRAVQGLLVPGLTAVAVAFLGDQFKEEQLGAAVGGYIGATVAGGFIGRVIGGVIADQWHWRVAFVIFAGLTLLGALMMALLLPYQGGGTTVSWLSAYRGMWRHARNRRLLGAFVIGAMLFFTHSGMFTYLGYYLTAEPFGLSTGVASSLYAVFLVGLITAPLAGRLAAHMPRRTIMAIGLAVTLLGTLGTLLPTLPLVMLSLVVLMIGLFVTQSNAPAFVNTTATTAKGGASALYLTFFYVGGAFGSVLPGYAWQVWGWIGVVSACAVALLIGLLADWLLCR